MRIVLYAERGHTERGTWFNRMIRRIRSKHMNELSDHKPKKVVICVE